ncbi:Rad52/Rad22 family DNA repair protein [Singulisphaera rosea]
MTQHPDLFAALAAPFDPSEVKVRSQSGRQLSYITARTVMNRLDEVLGPENWWDRYVPGENSVLCELTIRLPDGSTLMKSDAGGYAGMADSGDDDKSGYSDSFKRAAVKFGVARYLYRDGVPSFVRERYPADGHPEAAEAHVASTSPPPQASQATSGKPNGNGNGHQTPPRSGKALFAWVRDQEQRHSVGLLKYLNGWAKLQEFSGRMVDWDAEQVSIAYAEASRKLYALKAASSDSIDEAPEN